MDAPGYLEAVAKERELRTVIYLGLPEVVCGEWINNITPRLFVILTALKSPFIYDQPGDKDEVAQFLWTLHTEYTHDPFKRDKPRKSLCDRLAYLDIDNCNSEITEFMEATLLDAPDGPDRIPVASAPAWLIYRFRRDPFRMSKEETMETPLRELYQELRCDDKYNGEVVKNKLSDGIRGAWLDSLNTPEMIAARRKEEEAKK